MRALVYYGNKDVRLESNWKDPKLLDDKEYYSRPTSVLVDQQFEGKAKNYEQKMTGPFFFPRLMFDYGTVTPGFYFFDNEALRFLSILGGATYNSNKDLDFCGDNPQGLIILRISFLPSFIIFLGLLAFLNNSGVTKFTLTSVHWAERITAINRVKTES